MPDYSMSVVFPNKQSKSVAVRRDKGLLHGLECSIATDNLRIKVAIPTHQVFDCGQQISRAHKVVVWHPKFESGKFAPVSVSTILDDLAVSLGDCCVRHF